MTFDETIVLLAPILGRMAEIEEAEVKRHQEFMERAMTADPRKPTFNFIKSTNTGRK